MKFTGYSDAQWAAIRNVVGRIDLDADAIKVGKRSLRQELESSPHFYERITEMRRTPKQRAVMLREALEEIEAVRRRFSHRSLLPVSVAAYAPTEAKAACDALATLAARLQSNLDAVSDVANPSNATKAARNAFLHDLVQLWNRIGGGQSTRKAMEDFLVACALPAYPDLTAKAVENFVDRYAAKRPQAGAGRPT